MNSVVPVGLSLWLVYLAAFGVAVMTYLNGGDVMWSAVRGISALVVLSTLLWFAASVWRLPPKEDPEVAQPHEEVDEAGGMEGDEQDQHEQIENYSFTRD
jgi:hypothetical protein